ncbi:MAG: VOC family protein [Actinomycetota bacterium]|nr:VOC family protein [Actinomycetota bacterium]
MGPTWWLRQVAVLARDLGATVDAVGDTFDLAVCHRSDRIEGFAMANALLPVGEQFLEVASPLDGSSPAGRMLAGRGEGGYLVILQTDDLDGARSRAIAAGAVVTIELDEPDAHEIHFHPRSTGGVALAFDWMQPESHWRWAGSEWRHHVRTDVVTGIAGVTLSAPQHEVLATQWGQLLGIDPQAHAGALQIPLRGGFLRFVPGGSRPALHTVHLTGPGPASLQVGDLLVTTQLPE